METVPIWEHSSTSEDRCYEETQISAAVSLVPWYSTLSPTAGNP